MNVDLSLPLRGLWFLICRAHVELLPYLPYVFFDLSLCKNSALAQSFSISALSNTATKPSRGTVEAWKFFVSIEDRLWSGSIGDFD